VLVSIPEPEPSLPSPRLKVTEAEPKYGVVAPVNVIDCPVGAAESGVSVNGTEVVAPAPLVATTLCPVASVVAALQV
jgi:hypothetical protein